MCCFLHYIGSFVSKTSRLQVGMTGMTIPPKDSLKKQCFGMFWHQRSRALPTTNRSSRRQTCLHWPANTGRAPASQKQRPLVNRSPNAHRKKQSMRYAKHVGVAVVVVVVAGLRITS